MMTNLLYLRLQSSSFSRFFSCSELVSTLIQHFNQDPFLSLSVVSKLNINTHKIGRNIIKNIRIFSPLIVIIPFTISLLKYYRNSRTNYTKVYIIYCNFTSVVYIFMLQKIGVRISYKRESPCLCYTNERRIKKEGISNPLRIIQFE